MSATARSYWSTLCRLADKTGLLFFNFLKRNGYVKNLIRNFWYQWQNSIKYILTKENWRESSQIPLWFLRIEMIWWVDIFQKSIEFLV